MEQTRIRALWAAGKPVVNGWLSIPSTVTAEINARAGVDSLTDDLQHLGGLRGVAIGLVGEVKQP